MKTYYCVTSSFDNRGRVTAAITSSIKAKKKPKNTLKETPRLDIYNDWFDDYDAALKFVDDAKKA